MKGRFAPSPSGRMHLGNALSALLSYLSVKSKGGQWILRVEDLDPGRSRMEYERQIEDDLLWLGLEWDEGGMDNPDYCQSRRTDIYNEYIGRLEKMGLVYPCYCTRADLMAANAPHESDGRVIYPGTCRNPANAPQDGRVPRAWRVMVPDLELCVNDLHYGPATINLARDCGDFVIKRSDGTAAYQLAVVVDDALMGVTEVVRGRDLLLSSPQQAWLHRTLGFREPQFAHLPLLCASDGRRLCKRDKDMDMGEIRRRYTPDQVIGMLASMAALIPAGEAAKAKDLVPLFSWAKVPLNDIIL